MIDNDSVVADELAASTHASPDEPDVVTAPLLGLLVKTNPQIFGGLEDSRITEVPAELIDSPTSPDVALLPHSFRWVSRLELAYCRAHLRYF